VTDQLPLFKSVRRLGLFRGERYGYELRWFDKNEVGMLRIDAPYAASSDKRALLAIARLVETPVDDFTHEVQS